MKLQTFDITISVKRDGGGGDSTKLSVLVPGNVTTSIELLRAVEEAAKAGITKHVEEKTASTRPW